MIACGHYAEYDGFNEYTVTFHPDDGSPVPEPKILYGGDKVVEPPLMTRESPPPSGADAGLYRDAIVWYTDAAYTTVWDLNDPVHKNFDLYAKWTGPSPVDLSGETGDHILAKALSYIKAYTLSKTTAYTIVLDPGNYLLPGITSMEHEQANITTANTLIALIGKGPTEISLSSAGKLFFITAGELVLDNYISLKGIPSNDSSLIYASGTPAASASLTMKAGAKISGNTGSTSSLSSSGVKISYGTFIMNGGEISGNTGDSVFIDLANFVMSGGEISGNIGRGVYVNFLGDFTMTGGKISGNTSSSSGGGVYVESLADFTMSGGEISGNTASTSGGGVYVYGDFTMSGGKISGNTATLGGGGGVNAWGGSFAMSGGEISDNTARSYGGGVYAWDSDFTMSGGEVSGNIAHSSGGGVYIDGGSSFSKTGSGVIYGSDTDGRLKNTAGSGNTNGHTALYWENDNQYYRDITLNAGDDISTDTLPASGTGYNWTKK
jgi:hypothetical protein